MTHDVLTFIGRFQPFHNGHKAVVDEALTKAKKVALVIGSDQQPRYARNPWTTQERIDMITAVYPDEVASGRIHFCPQVDHTYNLDRWIGGIQSSAMAVSQKPFNPDPVTMGLIGHSKDASSFYLKAFPTWDNIEVANVEGINATDFRKDFFEDYSWFSKWYDKVPSAVMHWLNTWRMSDEFFTVEAEHAFLKKYKQQFTAPTDEEIVTAAKGFIGVENILKDFRAKYTTPYPPVFYTADAVVVQAGHILLVKRGGFPGQGLWALPGGFVNETEDSRVAAIRELREETRLAVPQPVLNGSITSFREFSDPYRSQRGRTVTMAYKFELSDNNGEGLPKVKGSDDAVKAVWVPISQLRRAAMFEDHYDIIECLVGL
jgi:bifunctional NMN adenylyltransferase/nudix hydrolase